jgi:hypothetical protein
MANIINSLVNFQILFWLDQRDAFLLLRRYDSCGTRDGRNVQTHSSERKTDRSLGNCATACRRILTMPLNLAVLTPDAADAIIASHPIIDRWFVGGHSLGGAMS